MNDDSFFRDYHSFGIVPSLSLNVSSLLSFYFYLSIYFFLSSLSFEMNINVVILHFLSSLTSQQPLPPIVQTVLQRVV